MRIALLILLFGLVLPVFGGKRNRNQQAQPSAAAQTPDAMQATNAGPTEAMPQGASAINQRLQMVNNQITKLTAQRDLIDKQIQHCEKLKETLLAARQSTNAPSMK